MTDTIISFLTKKYDDIIIDDESNLYMIEMYHRKNRRNTNILIEDNLIKIPKIKDEQHIYKEETQSLMTRNKLLEQEIQSIQSSISWNITSPLRKAKGAVRRKSN